MNAGGLSNGAGRPSVHEVAELAGVAISSVSRVLSGHKDVSEKMRDRVVAAVARLGYEPDFLAQSLRRGSTRTVGFVVGDITNPVMASCVQGAEAVLRGSGYSILLMDSGGDPALDEAHIRLLRSRRVDGMILSLASEKRRRTLDLLVDLDVPVVLLDREVPTRAHANAIYSDHRAGMKAAVSHLLTLGHRRIALMTPPLEMRAGRERVAGMKEAIAEQGLRDETMVFPGRLQPEHGEASTEEALAAAEPPTAIIAGSNQLLIGVLRALDKHSIQIGRDMALVTCDDSAVTEVFRPALATISRDLVGMGRTAGQLLEKRLRQVDQPEVVILPTTYQPRASACPPAV